MAKLVRESLTYSKAGIKATEVNLKRISLRPLVEKVVERETLGEDGIKIEISENEKGLAHPERLARSRQRSPKRRSLCRKRRRDHDFR